MYLGGMTITGAGWVGGHGVYVNFVSQYTAGWLWQMYANRSLIGHTTSPTDRRIVGQLLDDEVPAPLTLVRVEAVNVLVDYGPRLPELPWNRFALQWSAASFPVDTDHFTVTASRVPGGALDATNVVAAVPFQGDGDYSFALPPISRSGVWRYGVTAHDDARPDGNPGETSTVTVHAAVPPEDVVMDSRGRRFSVAVDAGLVTARFAFP